MKQMKDANYYTNTSTINLPILNVSFKEFKIMSELNRNDNKAIEGLVY